MFSFLQPSRTKPLTALDVILSPKSVHLLTDGAALNSAGAVERISSKVAILPHLNATIGINGTQALMVLATEAIQANISKPDDLRSNLPGVLQSVIRPLQAEIARGLHNTSLDGSIAVAAWSPEHGPHGYILATFEGIPALPAWQIIDVPAGGAYLTPSDPKLVADFGDLNERFDDERAGDLVERQRAIIGPSVGNFKTPIVGGFAQLTTVSEQGISTRIVRRFNDPIGKKIAA